MTGGITHGRLRAVVVGCLLLVAPVLTGCVEVPTGGPAPTAETPDLTPMEQLAAMPEVPIDELLAGTEENVVAFLSHDRNAYCTITTKQGGVIDTPVDKLLSGGERNDNELEVFAAYCEFGRYPEPKEITDNCNGTNLGFMGGTIVLTAETAVYGGCRVGMTLMESEFGIGAEPGDGPVAKLPVVDRGQAVELNGFRCGSITEGMVCAEMQTGVGFLVGDESYEIFGLQETEEP